MLLRPVASDPRDRCLLIPPAAWVGEAFREAVSPAEAALVVVSNRCL